ncbi:T9SS type A sorting domain-containing protein [Flavobacterium sp.]|uniref:T9SS type A sorting domain-containing protein n=1 Tax=Flavobacterium sp. TaxID=239 RepID=UPI00286E8D63|nr:T9SS type A sorting domain-containing protein [Flavobacterium sp.]
MIFKKIYILLFILVTTLCLGQLNVKISDVNNPTEPSICINPTNTNQLIAGSNINNVYKSDDGGATWSRKTLTSAYGVWGDPAIICDNNNNFYFFHLSNPPTSGSWIDRIVCQKTTNHGLTWSTGTFMGLNGSKAQDKQWAIFDNSTNNIYVTWTEFDVYGSSNPSDKSNIRFSKSTDFGSTWSTALKINNTDGNCVDESDTTEGAVPTVGSAGQIYVSWTGPAGIVFKKSLNQGTTWTTTEIPILPTHRWDFTIPGVDRTNGFPITDCDRSGGANNGTIYINWSDQSNGVNDTDIFLKKSTDGGVTWSASKRVNNDTTGKHQFFSWMTVDQTNGYIYIVFYDRRNHTDNNTDVYLAHSIDGGENFTNTKISTTPFIPSSTVFFGDYSNISAHNGVIRPIWGRQDGSVKSIWTALVSQSTLDTPEFEKNNSEENLISNYPNPSNSDSYVSFKLYKESNVSVKIFDLSGKEIQDVTNKKYPEGKHILTIKNQVLKPGEYLYKIKTDYYTKSKKMIVN